MPDTPFFDPRATRAYVAVWVRRIFFGPLSLLVCLAILYPFGVHWYDTQDALPFAVASLFVGFTLLVLWLFLHQVLQSDALPPLIPRNLAGLLSFELYRRLPHREGARPFDLLKAAIHTRRGLFFLELIGLRPEELISRVQTEVQALPADVIPLMLRADAYRELLKEPRVTGPMLLAVFFEQDGAFRSILDDADLSPEEIRIILQWEHFHHAQQEHHGFLHPRTLVKFFGGFGRSWVMGYTDELDRLTDDIGERILWNRKSVMIHQNRLRTIFQVLERSAEHNVLILGRAGSGKRTMIRNAAHILRKAEIEQSLSYTRFLVLRTEYLLSGTANPDMYFLRAMNKALEGGKFILIIENMGLFLQAGSTLLKGVLARFLQAGNIKIIGIADTQDYHAYIKNDPALDMLFQKITLDDCTDQETMAVLMEEYFALEEREHVAVTFKALKSIIDLSKRYVGKGAFPGKAVDILRDAVTAAHHAGEHFVQEEHIRDIISLKSNMDVRKLSESEKQRLLELEDELKQKVSGQDYAIRSLVNALKRARLDIHAGNRPLGTFLFLGPTGVGKTQTAKALAEKYFGSPEAMIRVDMNEYSTEASIPGIVGTSSGAGEGYLMKRVQDRPFSLILLDEIEKAHTSVLNLFLQVLDEGVLTDARGIKTDFRNTIIIATSNAGALFIRDFIRAHQHIPEEQFKKDLIDTILQQKIFSPEFINRFDEVILYYPLSIADTTKVAEMMIRDITRDLETKKGIRVVLEPDALQYIAERGYSTEFGAREMRRTVTDVIENYLADYLLKNEVKRGAEIRIARKDLEK